MRLIQKWLAAGALEDGERMRSEVGTVQGGIFWGRHLWSRGYFVATSGNVTDDVLKRYIEDQDVESQNDDFKVTE